MSRKNEELSVKIGTLEEAFWTDVKNDTEKQIKSVERQLKFLKAVVEMADKKLSELPK